MIESTEVRETPAVNATTKDLETKPDVKHVKDGLIDFIAGSLGKHFSIEVLTIASLIL